MVLTCYVSSDPPSLWDHFPSHPDLSGRGPKFYRHLPIFPIRLSGEGPVDGPLSVLLPFPAETSEVLLDPSFMLLNP